MYPLYNVGLTTRNKEGLGTGLSLGPFPQDWVWVIQPSLLSQCHLPVALKTLTPEHRPILPVRPSPARAEDTRLKGE